MIRILSEVIDGILSSAELTLLLKTTVVLALGLGAFGLARRARASMRHLLLSCTFAVLLAVPAAVLLAPAVSVEVPWITSKDSAATQTMTAAANSSAEAASLRPSESTSTTPSQSTFSKRTILWLVWGIGAMASFAAFAVALWRLARVRRTGIPWLEMQQPLLSISETAGVRRRVDVLLHDRIAVPVTMGAFHPVILLPVDARSWSEMDLRRVFLHELEHIKRGDWSMHVIARAVCAFYWFQPLAWVAWQRLCLEAERACDDAVLMRMERFDYAEQLVGLARRLTNALAPPVLSMANRSDLSRRVTAILDVNQRRGRIGTFTTALALSFAAVVVLGIAPVRALSRASANVAGIPTQKQTQKSSVQSKQQDVLDRALFEASESGDVSEITSLLESGADVNAAIDGDGSPLIAAAREGQMKAVILLLDRGADPNLAVPGDGNALIMAGREGHVDVVTLLLDRGAGIDTVVPGDENALIQASGEGELGVVKLLVSRGANVNVRVQSLETNGELRTALSMARKKGQVAVVEFLISSGARE